MSDKREFKYSTNGYWIEPDGTIHAMTEYQIHKQWLYDLHGEEWDIERFKIETEASERGWISITFGMLNTGFAIDFHENNVTKKGIRSVQKILKEHSPDDAVHINDCLGFKDGFSPWQIARTELNKYPEEIKKRPKLKKPVRGLLAKAIEDGMS